MIDPIQEQLSAFLDGELSAAESELLLKRIERDPSLKTMLERYVLAGEALRATQLQTRPSRDFSSRIATAIDSESAASRARGYAAQWLKPVAGGAIAAGVAAVAIVTFQIAPVTVTSVASDNASSAPGASVAINQVTNGSTQLATTFTHPDNSAGASFVVPSMGARRTAPPIQIMNSGQLTNYVVAHSEYSSPLSRSNVLMGLLVEDPTSADEAVSQFDSMPGASDAIVNNERVVPPSKTSADKKMLSRAPR